MSYYTGPTTFFERMKMNSKNGADTTPPIDKGDLKASKSSVSLRPAVQEFAPGRNHGEDDSASRSRLHSHPSVKLSENIQPVVQAPQIDPSLAPHLKPSSPAQINPSLAPHLRSGSPAQINPSLAPHLGINPSLAPHLRSGSPAQINPSPAPHLRSGQINPSLAPHLRSGSSAHINPSPAPHVKPSPAIEHNLSLAPHLRAPLTRPMSDSLAISTASVMQKPSGHDKLAPTLQSEPAGLWQNGIVERPGQLHALSPLSKVDVPSTFTKPSASLEAKTEPMQSATIAATPTESISIESRPDVLPKSSDLVKSSNFINKDSPNAVGKSIVPSVAIANDESVSKNVFAKATLMTPESTLSMFTPVELNDIKAAPESMQGSQSAVTSPMESLFADLEEVDPISAFDGSSHVAPTPSLKELLDEVREVQDSTNRNTLRALGYEDRLEELEWRIGRIEKAMNIRGPFSLTVKLPNGHTIKIDGVVARMKLVDLLRKVNELLGKRFARCTFRHKEVIMSMSERVGDYSVQPGDELHLIDAAASDL